MIIGSAFSIVVYAHNTMTMLAGVTVIFMTGCIGTVLVDAQHLRSAPNIPEDCSVCGISIERDKYNYMISGGSSAKSSSTYPWMVSLRQNPLMNQCGGAIIDEFHILTAAHCLKEPSSEESKVYFQTPSMKKMSPGMAIEKSIAHPKFNLTYSNSTSILITRYDIALLKLKEKIKCNEYKNPICLPDAGFNLPLGAKSIIAGWGRKETQIPDQRLHHGIVKRLDFSKCIKAVPEAENIKDHMLCEGGTKQSVCYGDSGTPLIHKIKEKHYAVGIAASETDVSCHPAEPVIFTDVVKFLNWIEKARKATSSSLKGRKYNKKQRCIGRRKIK